MPYILQTPAQIAMAKSYIDSKKFEDIPEMPNSLDENEKQACVYRDNWLWALNEKEINENAAPADIKQQLAADAENLESSNDYYPKSTDSDAEKAKKLIQSHLVMFHSELPGLIKKDVIEVTADTNPDDVIITASSPTPTSTPSPLTTKKESDFLSEWTRHHKIQEANLHKKYIPCGFTKTDDVFSGDYFIKHIADKDNPKAAPLISFDAKGNAKIHAATCANHKPPVTEAEQAALLVASFKARYPDPHTTFTMSGGTETLRNAVTRAFLEKDQYIHPITVVEKKKAEPAESPSGKSLQSTAAVDDEASSMGNRLTP